ncbi:MAG: hypothetical protein ACP5O2_08685 [Bacteroidales bacterium]
MKNFGKIWRATGLSYGILLIFIFIGGLILHSSCQLRSSQAERQQRAIEKRKEERRKQELAKYEAKKRRHEQMQGPEGKKLLKNAEKHSQKLDKASTPRKFFLWRWLGLSRSEPSCNP